MLNREDDRNLVVEETRVMEQRYQGKRAMRQEQRKYRQEDRGRRDLMNQFIMMALVNKTHPSLSYLVSGSGKQRVLWHTVVILLLQISD